MENEPLLPSSSSSSSSNKKQSNLENPKRKKLHRSKSTPSYITTPFNDLENYFSPIPNPPHFVKNNNSIIKQVILLIFLFIICVSICSLFMDQFKSKKTHPILDALYFCILTMCTIGYSDITPNSTLTKLFSILFVLVSLGLYHILITRFLTYFLDSRRNNTKTRTKVALRLAILVVCIGIGVFFMHFVEKIGWFDSFYYSFMGVASVGYGDDQRVFDSIGGRIFGSIWLVVSIVVFVRVFVLLVEVRVDERQRKVEDWVMEQDIMTTDQFHVVANDNNGFVSKSDYVLYKLKELGKIKERDILLINKQFERLDTSNCGRITLSNIIESHY